ncbi:ABC transporter permease [Nocardioides alcanivorans]|uniref:ABC transporter permease n=1 Tax=Nocardioides alcanivorans TaxID=2897352 RepID=UPI001F3510B4|nr:FtsX-like permease family protein [Nocardioides alcanivorans]
MGTTRGGWRVALRLARREAVRRKAQTALMLVLICLPVVVVTAAAVVWRTQDVSTVEGMDRRMGAADAYVVTSGFAEVIQLFDPEQGWDVIGDDAVHGAPGVVDQDGLDRVLAALGPDRTAVPLETESLHFRTDRGIGEVETIATDLGSPLSEGLVEQVDGQFPPGPGEVVVNQALADRGPGIGDTLTVVRQTETGEEEHELRVVGIAEGTSLRGHPVAAALPGAFGTDETDPTGRWLVGGGPVSWDDVEALNAIGALATSRQVLTDPPPASALPDGLSQFDQGRDEVTITVLALIAAMVLLEVVLLAGPAFAVRAKAQARTLALVAAAGGTPRQARRTVLASGAVVGMVGGLLGTVLGVGVGALAVPVAQRFDANRFGPFDVPWPLLAVVAGFGFLSAVLAAVVPAFSASRQDIVAVLAGRRGEGRPSSRSPLLGLVLLGVGILGAVVGAGGDGGGSAAVLIAGSAIISVLGMILLVPLTVTFVARLASGMPLSLRFAARDAARHRTRTVPAVAAVGATVAGVVALGIAVASQEASNEDGYVPMLPAGYGSVSTVNVDAATVAAVLDRRLPASNAIGLRVPQAATDEGTVEFEFRDGDQSLLLSYFSSLGTPYLVATELPGHVDLAAADRARADAVLTDGGWCCSTVRTPTSSDRCPR